jgi:hypothetical protein
MWQFLFLRNFNCKVFCAFQTHILLKASFSGARNGNVSKSEECTRQESGSTLKWYKRHILVKTILISSYRNHV